MPPPPSPRQRGPGFEISERRLRSGERVLLCSDGLLDGAADGVREAAGAGSSAAATARAALKAARRPLEDDAVVLVLAVA